MLFVHLPYRIKISFYLILSYLSIVTALQNYVIASKIYLVVLFLHHTDINHSTSYCYETLLIIYCSLCCCCPIENDASYTIHRKIR